MKVLGIIPAKAVSTGLPNKNIRIVAGKPMVCWTFEACNNSKGLDRVVLTTDSDEIIRLSKKYEKVECLFKRPKHLCQPDSSAIDTKIHTLDFLKEHEGYIPDYVFTLQPTSPERTTDDIDEAIEIVKRDQPEALSSYHKVAKGQHYLQSKDTKLMVPIINMSDTRYQCRQSFPEMYRENGAIILQTTQSLYTNYNNKNFKPSCSSQLSNKVQPLFSRPFTDIDYEKDLEEVQKKLIARLKTPEVVIKGRKIGKGHRPLVLVEIGINHEGSLVKAKQMVDDAHRAGAECVKFQCHVVDDEMSHEAKKVIPGNATKDIYTIMERCALNEEEDMELKRYVESKNMLYLCTPFSRAAADRLYRMDVDFFKIGSGECNNYPLIKHIASMGKPMVLSTGMNNLDSIRPAVDIFREHGIPFIIMHCVSLYPTPYDKVHLEAITQLETNFPDAVLGLSCHSMGVVTCYGGLSLGACVFEKHFTSDKTWPGPDVPISIDPSELKELIDGLDCLSKALVGKKQIFAEEQVTIDFAYACVVTIKPVKKGETFTKDNIWVKRPGTGQIKAKDFDNVLGKVATKDLENDYMVFIEDVDGFSSVKQNGISNGSS